ncbi:MAG: serine/threonine protein kinase [Sandaracinaceae bacterium]
MSQELSLPTAPDEASGVVGPYEVRSRLAVGGMAELFVAAEHRGAGEPGLVVLKRMLPAVASEPGAASMFEEEARLGGIIDHPNVVRVLGYGDAEGSPYLVLELVRGVDLARLLRWLRESNRILGTDLSLHVLGELLLGLDAVHRAVDTTGVPMGIVHGDVSPSNVLLGVHGEVKLADFGVARARLLDRYPHAAAAGRARGKLAYLSPERVTGAALDLRSDLFAVGVVAAELLSGVSLFGADSELATLLAIRDARVDRFLAAAERLPRAVRDAVLWALQRDPTERPTSASALRERFVDAMTIDPDTLAAELASLVARADPEAGVDHGHAPPEEVTRELPDELPGSTRPSALPSAPAPARPAGRSLGARTIDLADGGIIEALAECAVARSSGRWAFGSGGVRKEVYLDEGQPDFASSNLGRELLGEFLIRRGVLRRGELDMALAVMPRYDGSLGEALNALGLVEPPELFRHLQDQVMEKVLELFTWHAGEGRYEPGVLPPAHHLPLQLDPWAVLRQGIDRRLAQGLEQGTFAPRMMHRLRRSGTRVPPGVPDEVAQVVDALQTALPLHALAPRLERAGQWDPHRPYRATRLALALRLVHWVDPV